MTLRYVYGATLSVFAFGVVTVGPVYAQRRDGNLLPQERSGQVIAVGCLVRGDAVRGGDKDKYVLARPRTGPVASVPEARCTADPGADALTLDNPEKASMNDSMIGHWMEISGTLEKETDKNPDNLRELDVASAKMVPVVIPRPATATLATPRPAAAASSPAPRQAAAAPVMEPPTPQAPAAALAESSRMLPKTASDHPVIGLAGLLLLAVGLMLRSFRVRQQA